MPAGRNQVRIIGGRHRGRRLVFPPAAGLRPTPDRVRETLFNWLQPVVAGAHCLDLFAGSGALGLEAASRGAAKAVLLDRSASVVRQLRLNVERLGLQGVEVVHADALAWLSRTAGEPFDVVFLDPPYASRLQLPCAGRLDARGWLAAGAFVYVESSAQEQPPEMDATWQLYREKCSGGVCYRLYLVA